MVLLALSLLFSISLCVHAVRSGREMYWLFIILFLQPLGGIVYLAAVILPELSGGKTARRIKQAARERLDPEQAYREAGQALADTPSVRNRMRLAAAAAALGRHDEAEALYADAATGVHADDPALLLGRARALVEIGRPAEALSLLQRLGELGEAGRTAEAALAMGRAHHALGQLEQAETAFSWAAERGSGLEAWARYAVFLAETGRRAEAEVIVADLDARLPRIDTQHRNEARRWRDHAATATSPRALVRGD